MFNGAQLDRIEDTLDTLTNACIEFLNKQEATEDNKTSEKSIKLSNENVNLLSKNAKLIIKLESTKDELNYAIEEVIKLKEKNNELEKRKFNFTNEEEILLIKKLNNDGLTVKEIAKETGRSIPTVRKYIKKD